MKATLKTSVFPRWSWSWSWSLGWLIIQPYSWVLSVHWDPIRPEKKIRESKKVGTF